MSAEWIRGRVRLMHVIEIRKGTTWTFHGGVISVVPAEARSIRVYEWSAVNTMTGKRICGDNTACSLAEAIDNARHDVDLAREVWTRGIRYGKTKP